MPELGTIGLMGGFVLCAIPAWRYYQRRRRELQEEEADDAKQ